MENKTEETKSVWDDIKKVWGRIAGVIAAVGVIATFITKVFNTSPELTYSLFAALGFVLLAISFYVDKQSAYNHQEIINYEAKARADFIEVMQKARQQTLDMKEDSNKKIDSLTANVDKLLKVTAETRQDTARIQLIMVMEHQPDNIDTILKLAELYFVKLHGNWYMTNLFTKWAKEHNVMIPTNIFNAIDKLDENINE